MEKLVTMKINLIKVWYLYFFEGFFFERKCWILSLSVGYTVLQDTLYMMKTLVSKLNIVLICLKDHAVKSFTLLHCRCHTFQRIGNINVPSLMVEQRFRGSPIRIIYKRKYETTKRWSLLLVFLFVCFSSVNLILLSIVVIK